MGNPDPSSKSEKRDESLHNISSDSADYSENSESMNQKCKKVKTDENNSFIPSDTQRKDRQKRKRGARYLKHDKATRILYGEEQSSYNLYALINDDLGDDAQDSERLSKQPLRIIEPMIQEALGIFSEDLTKDVAFKINRFKKGGAKNFTIEIEVYNENHLKKLLEKVQIGEFKVKIVENFNKNCVKGTFKDFRCDFNGETEEDIKSYFHQKGVKEVTDVKRLGKSNVILLHFRGQTRPESLDVGTRRLKIKAFTPKPPRCFKCQSYSHPRQKCRSKDYVCFNCGEHYDSFEAHTPKTCKATAKCAHCGKEHRTGDTKCKVEELEMKFQKIMLDQGLRRDEAMRRYPKGEVTPFADIVARPTANLDFIFPTVPEAAPPREEMVFPQSETITSILNQNTEILRRLERIENSKVESVEQQVNKTDDNELKKTMKELLVRVNSLEEQVKISNQEIIQLKGKVAEKQATIDSQAEKIKKQEENIKKLQSQVVAASSICDEPAKDLLKANTNLINKNSELINRNSELLGQIKVLKDSGQKKGKGT